MPERNRLPYAIEMQDRVERMQWRQAEEKAATAIVEYFNRYADLPPLYWPTIRAALISKHPWVQILCETCGGIGEMDLRMKRRDPRSTVRVVLPEYKCPRCNGHGKPKVIGLARQHSR
jgi:hypothetical protein